MTAGFTFCIIAPIAVVIPAEFPMLPRIKKLRISQKYGKNQEVMEFIKT
jgi:hypothetical protein